MRSFVDTNVFVYRLDAEAGPKQPRAQAVLARLWRERSGRTSFQVLHEYYAVATRKLRLTPAAVRLGIRDLLVWRPVVHDDDVLDRAWRAQDRYGLSFWDALIVAAAQAAECTHLLTEDLQDGQDLDGVRVLNPFGDEAARLL
jgi:predicted nucleic acid-binding protein